MLFSVKDLHPSHSQYGSPEGRLYIHSFSKAMLNPCCVAQLGQGRVIVKRTRSGLCSEESQSNEGKDMYTDKVAHHALCGDLEQGKGVRGGAPDKVCKSAHLQDGWRFL